jgi:NAD(P)-dependent dehydrogenase (short-subunit alcohol dehydrogenase family)
MHIHFNSDHRENYRNCGNDELRAEGGLGGRVAIVTGGSRGIGLAIARLLIGQGARVAVFSRDDELLGSARRELQQLAGAVPILVIGGEVGCEPEVRAFFRAVERQFGRIDIVVNNAGFHHSAPLDGMRHVDWRAVLATHADGAFLFARAAFSHWKKARHGGSLLFVASKSGVAATPNAAAYAAAKAAQLHLARCLAEEGGPHGIRVNCVLPDGVIRGTGIFSPEQRVANALRHGVAPEVLEQFYAERNSLKKSIEPEDVARAIVFLCGEQARAISGATLTVDGGVVSSYMR